MAKQQNSNSSLDFIFKTPRKLAFTKLYRFYFDFVLRLLYRVILFENVPETVSETFMKLILYTQGKVCFLRGDLIGENDTQLLSLNCTRADTPDVYYIPRKVLVVNPRLKKSYNITPGEKCEVVYLSEADKYNLSEINGGLYSLIERTAVMLADNDISINTAQKNTRLVNLVGADTQNTVDSIRAAICSMYEGEPTIVVKSSLIDKLQGVPIIQNQTNHNLIELIEVQQYILSHFYEQIGICTHDQMKRERLITAEINDNLDLAFLNVDDILASLQEGLQRVNDMFGTNISAKLNPIIERQREKSGESQDAALDDNLQEPPNEEDQEETESGSEEQPLEVTSDDQEEEAAPEESEDQTEEEPEEEAEAEEPEEEAASEEEAAPEESEDQTEEEPPDQNIDINIDGDNNIIIIEGGGDNAENTEQTDADELPDVGSDNDERDRE